MKDFGDSDLQNYMQSELRVMAELAYILSKTSDERSVARILKRNAWIPYWCFCPVSGHSRYVFAEFPLSSNYAVDLAIVNSYSGVWEVFLIELEPVSDRVFTRAGTPSQRLAGAIKQVDDWREFIRKNEHIVRADLVRWSDQFDLLSYSANGDPVNGTGDRLADSRTNIWWKYKILIGRSSSLSSKVRSLMGRYSIHHNVEIVSYDRLLSISERRYEVRPENLLKLHTLVDSVTGTKRTK